MGRIGEEITLKIKSAVKAKLIELGIEIDNELPDYIMVLVANKKTEEQMERDLQLFLGSNTVLFCSWLMNVLKKLEEVTISNRSRKEKEPKDATKPKAAHKSVDEVKSESDEQTALKKIKREEDMDMDDSMDNDCLETGITAQEGLLGAEEEPEETSQTNEKSVTDVNVTEKKITEKSDRIESVVIESRPRSTEGRKRRSRSRQKSRIERSRKRSRSPRYTRGRSRSTGRWRSGSRHRVEHGRSRSPPISPRRPRRSSPSSRSRYREYDARSSGKTKSSHESPPRRSTPDRKRSRLMSSSSSSKAGENWLSSLVRMTSPPPRQTSHITANSKLLLKAVADAEKSVSSAERKPKRDAPKVRDSPQQKEQPQSQKENNMYLPPEKIFVTLQNNNTRVQSDELRAVLRNESRLDYRYSMEEDLADDRLDFEVDEDEEYVPEPVVKSNVTRPAYIPSYNDYTLLGLERSSTFIMSPDRSPSPWRDDDPNRSDWKRDQPLQEITKTVVTAALTPVMRNTITPSYRPTPYSRGRGGRGGFQSRFKLSHVAETARATVNRVGGLWERLGPPPTATVRPMPVTVSPTTNEAEKPAADVESVKLEALNKALERCKFWPDCADSSCVYYHPTNPCKMFPSCKYGMQCLFVHPDCKFGSDCSNAACNYAHKNSVKGGYALLCNYFPNCTNPFCKFRHPAKPCRYGSLCARTDCFYSHPPKPVIPPRELLVWKAPEKV